MTISSKQNGHLNLHAYCDVSSVRGASQSGAFGSALPKLPDCISCPWAATHFAAGSVTGMFEVANLSLQVYSKVGSLSSVLSRTLPNKSSSRTRASSFFGWIFCYAALATDILEHIRRQPSRDPASEDSRMAFQTWCNFYAIQVQAPSL